MPQDGPDTLVGNDVCIGQGARILPGAQIGNLAIVGAGAVVAGSVPDYSVVAGNPGSVVRAPVAPQNAARLNAISWWDCPIDKILADEALICGADIDSLERV